MPLHLTAKGTALALALLMYALAAQSGEVHVAVAANFAAPMEKIAADFAQDTGHKAVVIIGSTGRFYSQIKNGAPFQVLLAADAATPKRLVDEGLAIDAQRYTYAIGKLVLYSAQPGWVDDQGEVLRKGQFKHLALAHPQLAPYGAAGMDVLKALGVLDTVQAKIVQGDNIAQAFQFVATGNAELGFVALSQIKQGHPTGRAAIGSWWLVPASLYKPIQQDAVLLKRGEGQAAAVELLKYLRSDKAKAVIRAYGYDI